MNRTSLFCWSVRPRAIPSPLINGPRTARSSAMFRSGTASHNSPTVARSSSQPPKTRTKGCTSATPPTISARQCPVPSQCARPSSESSPKTHRNMCESGRATRCRSPCDPPAGYPRPIVSWVIQHANGTLRALNSSRMIVDPQGGLHFSHVETQDAFPHAVYACVASSRSLLEYKLGNKILLNVESRPEQ
ncbi:hypothetical protein HPB51_026053 [Rhipicephalus microplus]|uniref:Ig-like domain-containing protein n=1 Tax=Rhipicephalus microplus TaxID=6941 RepID=A0A9J6EF07_RHIMP|nr:hypothetical protein HPB51_026053 [Rhipicephalus microplus]